MSAPHRLRIAEDLRAQGEAVDTGVPEVLAGLAGLLFAKSGEQGAVAADAFPLLWHEHSPARGKHRLQLLPRSAQHLLCLRLVRGGPEDEGPSAAEARSGQARFRGRGANAIGAFG